MLGPRRARPVGGHGLDFSSSVRDAAYLQRFVVADPENGGVKSICLSPQGAQLLAGYPNRLDDHR